MKINGFSIISYSLVFVFIYLCITRLSSNAALFFNPQAIIVIGGGLVVACFASFPWLIIKQLLRSLGRRFMNPPTAPLKEANEIVKIAAVAASHWDHLKMQWDRIENPFLKESLGLALEGLPRKSIEKIMGDRIREENEIAGQDVTALMTLGKYAPALGLAATVLGLVELLSELGTADLQKMGIGMAVALSSTFYGIVISNLVFTPLAELLHSGSENERITQEMIMDGILAIVDREHPLVVGERVNSFLPAAKRIPFIDQADLFETESSPDRPVRPVGRMAA